MSITIDPFELFSLPKSVPPSRPGNDPGDPTEPPTVGRAPRLSLVAEGWRAFRDANLSGEDEKAERAFCAGVSFAVTTIIGGAK